MSKPPHPEIEYFGKIDAQNLKKLTQEKRLRMDQAELEQLRQLHHGHCAGCGWKFETFTFKGTQVQKCFHCGGVFLEAGTLEKLCGEESHLVEKILDIFRF